MTTQGDVMRICWRKKTATFKYQWRVSSEH